MKIIENKKLNSNLWRYLLNIWTVIFYTLIVADCYKNNSLHVFIEPVSAIYLAVLAVYTTQKEFQRWHNYNIGFHPGEKYVIIWTVLIIILFILDATNPNYVLPSEVFTSYLVVIGILAITKSSKKNYLELKKNKK